MVRIKEFKDKKAHMAEVANSDNYDAINEELRRDEKKLSVSVVIINF